MDTYSKFINVNHIIGMHIGYGSASFKIYRGKRSNVAIRKSLGKDNYYNDATAKLYANTVCTVCKTKPFWANKGEVLLDEAAVISVNISMERTKEKSEFTSNVTVTSGGLTRHITTLGENGKIYVVAANFGEGEEQVKLSKDAKDLCTHKTGREFVLRAENAKVFEIK